MAANPIEEDIRKGRFSRVYLLYGEEDYLKRYYRNRLRKAILPGDDTINLNVWQNQDIDLLALTGQADTMPFFAPHRLIIVEDSGLFKKGGADLAEYLPGMPEETVMVFVESEVDARSKLFKVVREIGRPLKLDHMDADRLQNWVLKLLNKDGKRIQRSALQLFLERVGNDLENVAREMEKLVCYVGEREDILLEDVETITTVRTENRVFDMVTAIVKKDEFTAMKLYEDLLLLRESPVGLLALLAGQFTRLWQMRQMRENGVDPNTIASRLGMKDYAVRKNLWQAMAFEQEDLHDILKLCARTDESIKTGRMEATLAVQLLLTTIIRRGA